MEALLPATPKVGAARVSADTCSMMLALGVRFRTGLQEIIRLPADPLIQNLHPLGNGNSIGGGQYGMPMVQPT